MVTMPYKPVANAIKNVLTVQDQAGQTVLPVTFNLTSIQFLSHATCVLMAPLAEMLSKTVIPAIFHVILVMDLFKRIV